MGERTVVCIELMIDGLSADANRAASSVARSQLSVPANLPGQNWAFFVSVALSLARHKPPSRDLRPSRVATDSNDADEDSAMLCPTDGQLIVTD